MEVQVWDNLLDDKFIIELDEESNYFNWKLGNTANRTSFPYGKKGSHLFFGATLFWKENDGFISNNEISRIVYDLYLHLLSSKLPYPFELKGISCNAQSLGQNGTPHLDAYGEGEDYTLMLFLNSQWEEEWGGEFQILESLDPNSKVLKSILPKPGRIVFFKGNVPHRGLGPKIPQITRKTLVYRLVKNE